LKKQGLVYKNNHIPIQEESMGRLKRGILITLSAVMVICLIVIVGGWFYVHQQLPQLDDVIVQKGIKQPVDIRRDQWGVPHIQGNSLEDAYFAYGFTLAQDRLFQMELQRRLARGELSEILGKSLLDVDKMFRTLLFRRWGEQYLANAASINPKALATLDAFTSGVNAFIGQDQLPVEFKLLGFQPRPYTRLDCMVMVGYMAYSFTEGIQRDSLQTMLKSALTDSDLENIFPVHTLENRMSIVDPEGTAGFRSVAKADSGGSSTVVNTRSGSSDQQMEEMLAQLQDTLLTAAKIDPPFIGSNSWVLGPKRSKSGHALIANDPHIGIANPGVWYEAHIRYPGYENYGYHLPLVPFPMLAHNSKKGWAITMLLNDDIDLFAETFNPENPNQVMYKGKWENAQTYQEFVKVKGEADVPLIIRVTPHGPIISDYIEGYKGTPVAVHWVALTEKNPVLNAMYGMAVADNIQDFEKAVSQLVAPGLNVSYADVHGDIGWWAVGRFPVRPVGISGHEINDGSNGLADWQGIVPFAQNPKLINPDNGMIITANHQPTLKPVGTIPLVTGYFRPSDRPRRIHQLLSTQKTWTAKEMMRVQTDNQLGYGVEMTKGILKAVTTSGASLNPTEQQALKAIKNWDGNMNLTSVGGTVFQFTTYHILRNTLGDFMNDDLLKRYLNLVPHWDYLKRILNGHATPLQGRVVSTSKSLQDLILVGFQDGVKEMQEKLGDDPADWQWGEVHTIEFVHPVGRKKPLNLLFNVGPFPSPSEFTSINKIKSNIGNHEYKVSSLPSTRRLINIGDPEQSYSILPTGNSGNFQSDYYDNQAQMFITGQYRKIVFTEAQIKQNTRHHLVLRPE
jgi:penicillin G amidase